MSVLLPLFLYSQFLFASELAHTQANSIPLLELYTSESCSSCPVADK